MARIEDSKKAQEVLLFIETARINVKKITEEALVKPTSKEAIKSKIEAQIKACSEFLKAQGPIYQELAKSAYNGLKKLSNECLKQIDAFFAANQSNDLVKALALAYKQETDTTKKTSKTFVIGDGELNLEEDMSVKFKETSGEYGYDQMIIDDYQERVKQAIQNISKLTLTEKTFKEVNGRKVGAPVFLSIRNKAEMTVRYEAMKEELKELCDSGEQYVIVSQHKDASKRCSPLQGLLYKLDVDPTQDVKCVLSSKELGTRRPKQIGTVDGNPYYSLKEAMSYGLFSYNCRHRFIKYIPGSKVTPQYKYDEKAAEEKREIDKNMREMERQIRALKERQVLALDSKERKFYQDESKQAQAKYKAYATKHGRDINLWRCSITKVERSAKGLTKTVENDIFESGGIFGARKDHSPEANAHAEMYYEEVRKNKTDCERISKNTGIDIKKIERVKNHVFFEKHDLMTGYKRFDSDFKMAQAWQRLSNNPDEIRQSDIILIEHEYLESQYMSQGYKYIEAHKLACKEYDWESYLRKEEDDD